MVKTILTVASCLILILPLRAETPVEPSEKERLDKVQELLQATRVAEENLSAATEQEKAEKDPERAKIAATRRKAAELILEAAREELALAMRRWMAGTVTVTAAGKAKDFRDEDKWSYAFNVGYEFATVNKLFEEGFPRTGLLIYRTFVHDNGDAWGWHGFDLFGDVAAGSGLYHRPGKDCAMPKRRHLRRKDVDFPRKLVSLLRATT